MLLKLFLFSNHEASALGACDDCQTVWHTAHHSKALLPEWITEKKTAERVEFSAFKIIWFQIQSETNMFDQNI